MTDKRDAILTTTKQLIYENGLQSVSMAQIARVAGVGIGTIYNYFPSKEALVNELFDSISQSLSEAILGALRDGEPTETQLKRFCRATLRYGQAHPQDLLLYVQLNHSAYILDEVQQRDHGMKATFFGLVQAGQTAGIVKPLEPVLLGNLQVSYAAGIIRANLRNGVALDEAVIEQTTAAWLDLLRAT